MSLNPLSDPYYAAFGDWLLSGDKTALSAHLATDDNLLRLNVYRNTFVAGNIDTLERRYPSVAHAVDQEPFRQIARRYAQDCPPTARTMTEYGQSFPEFLNEHDHPPYPAGLLADLAQLDRAWSKVYFAKEPDALSQQDIEALAANIDSATLSLNDIAQPVTTHLAVVEIWAQLRDAALTSPMMLEAGNQHALLFRTPEGAVRYSILTDPEAAFVASIDTGFTLSEAAQRASEIGQFNIADTFANLITNRILKKRD